MMRVEIDTLGGNCPVQAEGFITTERHGCCPFYFRARGQSITVELRLNDGSYRTWSIRYGRQYDAGWITEEFARGCIHEAMHVFDWYSPEEWDNRL